MAIVPRRMPSPTRSPAWPVTIIVPFDMPSASPGRAAPRKSPVLPEIWITAHRNAATTHILSQQIADGPMDLDEARGHLGTHAIELGGAAMYHDMAGIAPGDLE